MLGTSGNPKSLKNNHLDKQLECATANAQIVGEDLLRTFRKFYLWFSVTSDQWKNTGGGGVGVKGVY